MTPAQKMRRIIASGKPFDDPHSVLEVNRKCVIKLLTDIAREGTPETARLFEAEIAAGTEYELAKDLLPCLSPGVRDRIAALLEVKAYAERQLS